MMRARWFEVAGPGNQAAVRRTRNGIDGTLDVCGVAHAWPSSPYQPTLQRLYERTTFGHKRLEEYRHKIATRV